MKVQKIPAGQKTGKIFIILRLSFYSDTEYQHSTQEIIFIAIPIFSPAMLETIPMIHGIRMPPKLAAGE